MNTLGYKFCADFWQHKARSLLAVISVAAGIFIVGTLLGMMDLQLAALDSAHQASHPAHISLYLKQDADAALLEPLKNQDEVNSVEGLSQLSVRFKTPGVSDWQWANLIIRPDYQHQQFDQTPLQNGAWPAAGQIGIEQLSAAYSGLQTGERLQFAKPSGELPLSINGSLRHPFVKPPRFGGPLHFFATPQTAERFGITPHSFRHLLVQIKAPYSGDKARQVAYQLRAILAQHGIGVYATLLQDPHQHWGRPFFLGINQVLQFMAWASLGLACVLMLNTVSAHITQETRQIGIMKALGIKTLTLAQLYLGQVAAMASLALVLAVPLSLVTAYASSCWMLALFNVECRAFSYSPHALFAMLVGGLLMPLVAALPAIWRGLRLTVREALANQAVSVDFGASRFDVWLEHWVSRFLPTLYAAALNNLFRRKARLLWTQAVLVIAGVLFMLVCSLISSLDFTLDQEMARSRYDVRVGFMRDQAIDKLQALANANPATRSSTFWQRLPLEITQNGQALHQKGSMGLQLLALPTETALYQPLIESGRWLQTEDNGEHRLVLSADTAELNHLHVGDWLDVQLAGQSSHWQLIGTYRWLAGNGFVVEPVYAALQTVKAFTGDMQAASLMLLQANLNNPAEERAYFDALKQDFLAAGIELDIYNSHGKREQRGYIDRQFSSVNGMLLGLACLVAVVGGLGLSGTLAINVLQRIPEIGVLRAIGARPAQIFRLFILEGLLQGLLACSISVPLAYLAAQPLAQQLGVTLLGIELDFVFSWFGVALWLVLTLLLTLIAAYWPARQATRLAVRANLSH